MSNFINLTQEEAEEKYYSICEEICSISKKEKNKILRDRRSKLLLKVEEIEAIYFGNPKKLTICSACNLRVVKGYHRNGVFLTRICPICFKRKGEEISFGGTNRNKIGGKVVARS